MFGKTEVMAHDAIGFARLKACIERVCERQNGRGGCQAFGEMYYRGEVHPHRTSDEVCTELQHVTRQHEFVTELYVQAKLNTRALLDQVKGSRGRIYFLTSLCINTYSERCAIFDDKMEKKFNFCYKIRGDILL